MASNRGGGGGGAGPSVDQLKIAQQMFAMLEQMRTSAAKMSESFESQAASTSKMAQNMSGMSTGEVVTQLVEVNATLKEVAAALKDLNSTSAETFAAISAGAVGTTGSLNSLADATTRVSDATDGEIDALEELKKELARTGGYASSFQDKLDAIADYAANEFPVSFGAAAGALNGFKQTLNNITAGATSITNFFSSVLSGVFELGKALIALPLDLLGGLVEMANSGGGGGGGVSELTEAINGLRKEFGSMTGPTNKGIMGLTASMNGLNVAGMNATTMFGNTVDRIKLLSGLFSEGGAGVRSFTDEIVKSGGAVLVYQKGLGLSNEGMGTLASLAQRDGKKMTTVLNNITKQSLAMGKAFGLDAKIISKEIVKAAANMATFGHMSEKQLGVAVTYAARLGMSLENIAGTLDTFATFEDAAENVSTLNSTFGTNIDLNEMMEAQDPAAQAEIIRKAMLAQGITADKLDFRQRKLFKSLTGFDDAAVNATLSTSNQSKGLAEIEKTGKKAEKTLLSDAQAMEKLADGIDRVFKDGGGGGDRPKSFWEAFKSGMESGFKSLPAVQNLFSKIRGVTDVFAKSGAKFSAMVFDKFPGIQKIIASLTELFDAGKFGALFDKIIGRVGKFFDNIKTGKYSFKELMKDLKKDFFDFFDSSKGAGGGLLDGFGEFFGAIKTIFGEVIEWLMKSMGNVMNDLSDALTSDKPNVTGAKDAAGNLLSPIGDAISRGWEVLGPAISRLFGVLFGKLADVIAPMVKEWALNNWHWIAVFLFGPAAASALLGAGAALLGKGVAKLFSKVFGGAAKDPSVQDSIKQLNDDLSAKMSKMQGGGQAPGPQMTDEQMKSYKKMETSMAWSKILQFLVGLAVVVTIGLVAYFLALKIVKGKSIKDVLLAGLLLVVIAGTAVIAAIAFDKITKAGDPSWPKIGKFLVMMGVTMGIGLLAMWGIIAMVKKYNVQPKDLIVMGGIIIAMGLLGAMAGAIAFIAAKVGSLPVKEIAIGFVAMAIVLAGLIFAAAQIIDTLKSAKDVNPALLEGAVHLIEALGNLAMKSGIIIAEAAIIGAGIMASVGIAAAAIAIGLATMATVVGVITEGVMVIIKELNALKIVGSADEFKLKIDAFVLLSNVVVNMISVTGDIIDSISSMTSIFSSAADDAAMIKSVTEFVKALFDGLKDVVDVMIKAAKEIPSDKTEQIKVFAMLLGTVGTLLSAVGDSASSFVSETSSFMENIGPGAWFGMKPAGVAKKMDSLTNYVNILLPAMGTLITGIIAALANVKTDPATLGAVGTAVGGIFTGIAALTKGIMPDASQFKKTVKSAGMLGMGGVEIETIDTDAMAASMTFMTTMMDKLSTVLPPLIKSIGDELVSIVGRIDKDKIGALGALGSILGAVATLATGLMPKADVKMPEKSSMIQIGDNVTNVTVAAPDLGKSMQDLAKYLPPLLDVIISAAAKMPTGEGADKQIEQLTKVFDMLPGLAEMAEKLSKSMGAEATWLDSAKENSDAKRTSMITGIKSMTAFLKTVVTDPLVLPDLINTLKTASTTIGDAAVTTKAIDSLKSIFSGLTSMGTDVFEKLESFVDKLDTGDMEDITTQLVEKSPIFTLLLDAFTPFGKSMAGFAKGLSDMGNEISTAAKIDPDTLIKGFQTTLDTLTKVLMSEALARADGLKAKATYMQNIIGAGVVPTVRAVEEMVESAKKLESALEKGFQINLDAKLKSFASNFGKVGAKGAYTVTAKDVNIHVRFNVTMDAQAIERIMITSASSVIRNRLNLLIDASNDSGDAAEGAQKSLAASGKITPGQTPQML